MHYISQKNNNALRVLVRGIGVAVYRGAPVRWLMTMIMHIDWLINMSNAFIFEKCIYTLRNVFIYAKNISFYRNIFIQCKNSFLHSEMHAIIIFASLLYYLSHLCFILKKKFKKIYWRLWRPLTTFGAISTFI